MIEILQAHSLTATGYIQAESMGVTEKERSSTASIIEEMTAETRETGTWIRDGKSRIWRISRIEENPVAKTRTLQLETIFQILKDRIIPQEITAADMGGSDSCTAAQALRAILGYQSDWILGACDYTDSNPYSFSGEDLLSAVETVLTSLEEPWLEFDVSRYPFVVNVRKASQTPQCEMRMSRNIVSMRKSIDMSRMFTRFYPIGKEDLRLPGSGYMSRNERAYGIREKSATDQSRETVEALRSWATEQLYKHARPDVTITISGIELAAATGESLDRLTVGTVCRVPLPEFGTSENERIIQKSWADELNRPEDVTVTLGNEIQDVARILKQEVTGSASTAVRSGRAGSKKAKEDHAWFVDTTDHVSMVAEAVAGPGASKDWSRVAEITVDGKGIHQRVTETEGNVVKHEARLEINEKAIKAEVKERTKGDQINAGMLDIQSDRVGLLVGQKESRKVVTVASFSDLSGYAGDTARIYYIANEKKYYEWKNGRWIENVGPGNYINAGGIVSAINGDGSITTRIKGDRILVGNNVEKTLASLKLPEWMDTTTGLIADKATVGQFQALDARIGTLETDAITTANLSAKIAALGTVNVSALKASGNVTVSGAVYGSQFYVGTAAPYKNISDGIAAVQVAGPSSNVYTLQYKRFSDSSWQDAGNFSRAVASWTMGWSSGKFTAKANPQNQSCNTTLVQGTPSWDGNVVTIPVEAVDSDNPNYQYATGRSVVANAAARYNAGYVAGWNAARAKVFRSGNSVYRPKARSGTDITTDVGTEAYATAGLNNYSAWGAARLYLQRKTPGGTTSWEKVANFDTEYSVTSGTTIYYFKAYDGYYGWNTQPAIEWQ